MPWGAQWLFLVFIAEDEDVEVMFFDPACEPEAASPDAGPGKVGC